MGKGLTEIRMRPLHRGVFPGGGSCSLGQRTPTRGVGPRPGSTASQARPRHVGGAHAGVPAVGRILGGHAGLGARGHGPPRPLLHVRHVRQLGPERRPTRHPGPRLRSTLWAVRSVERWPGHPRDVPCLDGTVFFDDDGTPWSVYSRGAEGIPGESPASPTSRCMPGRCRRT